MLLIYALSIYKNPTAQAQFLNIKQKEKKYLPGKGFEIKKLLLWKYIKSRNIVEIFLLVAGMLNVKSRHKFSLMMCKKYTENGG